ncbi:hypothetical protein TthHB5008_11840 [Thermus thermophilus]|nr:hypothetical protein TthHB5008_11840 [Thermus thermophilus]
MDAARRRFLSLLALGGVATLPRAKGVPSQEDVLALALAAEELAREVYRRAVAARPFRGPWAAYLEAALAQEEEHARRLREALGRQPALRFRLPEVFQSPIPLLRLLESLEEAFVGAYLGALPLLEGEALRLAGAILGVEAGHRVLVRQARLELQDPLLRPPFVANDRALERTLSPEEAREALKPYLP